MHFLLALYLSLHYDYDYDDYCYYYGSVYTVSFHFAVPNFMKIGLVFSRNQNKHHERMKERTNLPTNMRDQDTSWSGIVTLYTTQCCSMAPLWV